MAAEASERVSIGTHGESGMGFAWRRCARLALAAALLAVAPTALALSAPKPFFRPHAATLAKTGPVSRAPGVVSEAVAVEFNADEMLALRPGEEVALTLPNAVSHAVVFEEAQSHGGGTHSWVGYVKSRGTHNRVIVTTGRGGSYGVLELPGGSYRMLPGKGHDWLVDMAQEARHVPLATPRDDSRVPPVSAKRAPVGEPTYRERPRVLPGAASGKVAPTPQAVIDLMVVATRGLATRLGATLMTRLHFLVTRANTTYADSDVAMTLRLVKLAVVDYPDDTTAAPDDAALDAITPVLGGGSGTFADIELQRQAAGADLVAFLRDGAPFGGSGVAWVSAMGRDPPYINPDPAYMYSVVTGCVAGCESVFIHELGHNMGNRHDRYTNAYQDGGVSQPTELPYAYGYAYCRGGALTCTPDIVNGRRGNCTAGQPECATPDNNNFRDIMAYFQASTQQIYKFSNPLLMCATTNGDGALQPCGVSRAAADSADTAEAMNVHRDRISGVKTAVSAAQMPGSLQFTQAAFSGSEAGGAITFTVSRMRDSTLAGGGGAVSVQYSVSAATASAGADYTVSTGTLSWGDGDFADQAFSIAIVNDGLAEPVETFTATLTILSGAPGVFLGYPSTAVGMILEAWPAGNVLPAGFATPAASSGAWSVAADASLEGGSSLRSAQVYGNGDMATYSRSELVYSGPLAAGLAAFAYRVSSYQGFGVFEFLVDGRIVLTDTGETGWKTYVFEIAAADHHRLTWRFKNRLPAPCAGAWIPPAEGGAACADRVWIDAVSLPPAIALPDPPRLANISTRMNVSTGDEVMIGGFIIGGSASKTVVVRARGPSLVPFGILNPLQDPVLELVRSSDQSVIATNDDWALADNASEVSASGFAPLSALESAILVNLPPGAYTAIVSGLNGGTGVGIVEVFELGATTVPLANISTRGRVLTGDDVMIGGFVVQGTGPQTVVVRARGPSLVPFGVTNALANPSLRLVRSSDQSTVATNDDWFTAANAASLSASGFAPSNGLEAAILIALDPGAYTAIVSGAGATTGVGIVEVFTLP